MTLAGWTSARQGQPPCAHPLAPKERRAAAAAVRDLKRLREDPSPEELPAPTGLDDADGAASAPQRSAADAAKGRWHPPPEQPCVVPGRPGTLMRRRAASTSASTRPRDWSRHAATAPVREEVCMTRKSEELTERERESPKSAGGERERERRPARASQTGAETERSERKSQKQGAQGHGCPPSELVCSEGSRPGRLERDGRASRTRDTP